MRIGGQIGVWHIEKTEDAIRAMGEAGLDGIEVFIDHLVPYHADPAALSQALTDAGIELSGAYFHTNRFVDPAAEDELVEHAAKASRCLAAIGGGFLVANGGAFWGEEKGAERPAYTDADFEQLAKILNRIADTVAAEGIATVMHPHLKSTVETLADIDRLIASGLDQSKVGLCVHASHQAMIGADPYEIYEAHGGWVRYAHIGSAGATGGGFLDEGTLDQERLMKPLLDAGFDGWIIIECGKKDTTPADYAANSTAYMKSTWPDVNWGK